MGTVDPSNPFAQEGAEGMEIGNLPPRSLRPSAISALVSEFPGFESVRSV
jgi:hypothetical protein